MPARFVGVVGFVLISLGCASQASADLFTSFFCSIAKDIKRRQCWPAPFVAEDRVAVRTPFSTMVANGWRRQNMLGDFHFEQGTGQLTEAGRLKVRWILTTGPEQHRLIYVHAADNDQETSARIVAVEQLASQISPTNLPPVQATSIADDGWSASQVDAIERKYSGSQPSPRLSPAGSSGGGASSGGSGSQ
jgi:uncharacterized membrane protein YgcG